MRVIKGVRVVRREGGGLLRARWAGFAPHLMMRGQTVGLWAFVGCCSLAPLMIGGSETLWSPVSGGRQDGVCGRPKSLACLYFLFFSFSMGIRIPIERRAETKRASLVGRLRGSTGGRRGFGGALSGICWASSGFSGLFGAFRGFSGLYQEFARILPT